MPKEKLPDDNWRGRAQAMLCHTCVSFLLKRGEIGRCRRNPPTMRGFPVVYESDWCDSHKIDENKV